MRKKLLLSFLLIVASPSFLFAQNAYDFSQFWKETGLFFTQPLRWQGEDWYHLGLVSASTVGAMAIEPLPSQVPFANSALYNSLPITLGRMYGELYTPCAFFAGYAAVSLITGDTLARKIAFEIGQTCLYGGATVLVMKTIVGRARPYAFAGRQTYHPFTITDDTYHSMPSGHTTIGFAISTILSMNAKPLWLKILAYVPAFLTPWSRAYQGFHWTSDCIMGAGIGYFFGKWVYDQHESNLASGEKSAIQVTSIYPLGVSIALK